MNISFSRHRTNDVVSGLLHLTGVGLAIAVLVVLVVLGTKKGSSWHTIGYSLYGSGLVLLYLASASYHLLPTAWVRTKHIAQRLDHAMIAVLIAATYTPVLFIALSGGWRWSLFGVIWSLATVSVVIKLFGFRISPLLSGGIYLAMGWLIVIAFSPLVQNLSLATLTLLISGGISYTVGLIFFSLERFFPPRKYFWMHEIFHVFVLGGSALHTIAMFQLL